MDLREKKFVQIEWKKKKLNYKEKVNVRMMDSFCQNFVVLKWACTTCLRLIALVEMSTSFQLWKLTWLEISYDLNSIFKKNWILLPTIATNIDF